MLSVAGELLVAAYSKQELRATWVERPRSAGFEIA